MTSSGDLIQIVIPCFNGGQYLEETLIGIQNQTHKNFNCLIIDDASIDTSSEIAKRFATKDKRFRLLSNPQNLGESYSVNRGWESRVSNLITILSCDDPQKSDWLSTLLDFKRVNPGFIVYYPNREIIDNKGHVLRREILFDWSIDLLRRDLLCIVSVGALVDCDLLPKDFAPRIVDIRFPSDLIQYLRISKYGGGLRHPNYFCAWREHNEGKSADDPITLAEQFALGMRTYLDFDTDSSRMINTSAVYAHIFRLLQQKFSLNRSLIFGLRIFRLYFPLSGLRPLEFCKLFFRFIQRKNFHKNALTNL
jgi:glycosyltransferase involved in cell wall biosynthesis